MIGAHPDDCEFKAGGLATRLRARGDIVKFVSATNGAAGHHKMGGGILARRRYEETRRVVEGAGIEYEVLDIPDGCLEADLATRERFIQLIREFQPDLLFTHRPNDYHPDHRRTGILVQDASYLIRVPNLCPLTPHLTKTPVILYFSDSFQKPIPFVPEIVVGIDDAMEGKVDMLHCHVSQLYEWLPYDGGYETDVPTSDDERRTWLKARQERRDGAITERFRSALVARYGEAQGNALRFCEAFEVSEYGRGLSTDEIDLYFPR